MDWLKASAGDLGRGIGSGAIDPVDLTEAYLAAIAGHPERDRIYTVTTAERARAEAMAASNRARAGSRQGLLDGVPISWKDLFDSAGVATEAGTALLKGRVPDADAAVLAQATRAGLVCLGKTHMTELAFSGLGLNPVTATPPNAFEPERVPGGSSSGAAVSTALGLAAAGIGSDTGGSVRVPSGWNGLVGLKTTIGLLSVEGVVPLAHGFDTVGPLCRSVEDCGLLLAAMGGGKAPDLGGANVTGLRFAVPRAATLKPIEDAPQSAFEDALSRLAAAGAIIEELDMPEIDAVMPLSAHLFSPEAYGNWKQAIEAQPGAMFPPVLERFRLGGPVSAIDYIAAWRQLTNIRQEYLARAAGYDAVLIPNSPVMPPKIADLLADHAYFSEINLKALRNTRIGNLLGLSALTLPLAEPMCALMVMGRPMGEAQLLRVGEGISRALA